MRRCFELAVLQFSADLERARQLVDRLGVVAGVPVDQPQIAECLAFFKVIAELLLHGERSA